MKAMTTKLSCEKLAQVISIKKVKEYWCVTLMETKNIFGVHDKIVWQYQNYSDALDQYVSLVKSQAEHIAMMSL